MAKFSIALREISTHKELLRSQVIVCQLLQYNHCLIFLKGFVVTQVEKIDLVHIAVLTILDVAS